MTATALNAMRYVTNLVERKYPGTIPDPLMFRHGVGIMVKKVVDTGRDLPGGFTADKIEKHDELTNGMVSDTLELLDTRDVNEILGSLDKVVEKRDNLIRNRFRNWEVHKMSSGAPAHSWLGTLHAATTAAVMRAVSEVLDKNTVKEMFKSRIDNIKEIPKRVAEAVNEIDDAVDSDVIRAAEKVAEDANKVAVSATESVIAIAEKYNKTRMTVEVVEPGIRITNTNVEALREAIDEIKSENLKKKNSIRATARKTLNEIEKMIRSL